MKTYTPEDLKEVLKQHWAWLNDEATGSCANLSRANLYGADLYGANLSRANLYGADLYGANLSCANLSCADLSRADLSRANLSRANLYGADLYGANLYGANLSRANLDKVVLPPFLLSPEGTFVAFKKVKTSSGAAVLLKLQIPEDAPRTNSPISRKCRTSKALVLEATRLDRVPVGESEIFYSSHDPQFTYRVGQMVEEPNFNPDIREECTAGIHYFINRQEAEEYGI